MCRGKVKEYRKYLVQNLPVGSGQIGHIAGEERAARRVRGAEKRPEA